MKTINFSRLHDKLNQYLLQPNHTNKQSVQSVINNDPLVLSLLQYKQSTMFVSDQQFSIQFNIYDANKEAQMDYRLSVNAYNRFQSKYYRKLDEKYYCFWEPHNCRHQELIDCPISDYPHPYQPQYYMPDMSTFKQFKKKGESVMVNSKVVRITSWKIKIVNVSETGWYAPIIEAISCKIEGPSLKREFKDVSMILFEKSVRDLMESFRLHDMRNPSMLSDSWKQKVSMTYHMKSFDPNYSQKFVNFYVSDDDQRFLNFDEKRKKYFLPFGKMTEQNIMLSKPVNTPVIDQVKINRNMLDFFKKIERPKKVPTSIDEPLYPEEVEEYHQGQLWSSDESEGQHFGNRNRMVSQQSEQQQEEESDSQDPLRTLYLTQIKQKLLK